MKTPARTLYALLFTAGIAAQPASAQSTWTGSNLGTDMNWSDAANWSGGAPGSSSAVTFPDGAYPVTTNTAGAVNNIVSASTSIASLTYLNNSAGSDYVTTLIPTGSTLTVAGGLTVSDSGVITSAAIKGGGSLIAGTNGTSTILLETTGSGTLALDLSGLTNFVFNAGASSPGSLDIANQLAPAGGSQTMNLAAVSNNITLNTLNAGNNNTRGTVVLNLGNGTNVINVDTINIGESKTSGTMQFINNAGGGLKLASHTGTGRTAINMGTEGNSGSTSTVSTGKLLFSGGTVNILAGTITEANRSNRADSPGALALLSFNSGTVDATTINMAINTSGGGSAFATNAVGGSGVLIIGSGGMSMINQGGTAGASALVITNGGTVICSNNIYKSTVNGVANITMSGGSLNLASLAGSIGVSNGIPIDNFNITNSTLVLPVVTGSPSVAVTAINPDTATATTININAMPSITSFPTQFPLITYTTPGGNLSTGGILPNIVLGSLPNTFGTFAGYLSNDVATATIYLVVTSGPLIGAAEWGGGINNQWNTTTLNWTNSGFPVAYQDGDFVTFDDVGQTGNVNITATRKPGTLTFNNNTLNYTFTGSGNISGPVQLVINGSATNTLAETGGDNFSLGIAANNGTLILDDTNNAITGGLTIGGSATVQIGKNDANGALPGGTLDDEGTLIFNRSNNLNIATAIPGGGAVVQNGSGILTLSSANTYRGSTTVNAGTLALTGSGAIASSSQVNVSAATLDVSGVTTSATISTLNLTNSTLALKVGYLQTNFFLSNVNLGGTGNVINVKSLPAIATYPATLVLLQSANAMSGYNFTLGTLPAASPAYAGSITESANQTLVLLTLTAGPLGTRPSVTWSGVDALAIGNTNWSDAQNWQTPGVPAAAEKVTFNDTAVSGGSPYNNLGQGNSGVANQGNIDNFVDISLTNAGLSYVNASDYHNTEIGLGKTLTVNGSLAVTGASGVATILGTNAVLQINNPGSGTLTVANASTPTLDLSGLGTLNANFSQMGVGYNPASSSSVVNGTLYLARTNYITAGPGSSGTGASLVIGGGLAATAGSGTVYLGQSNVLFLDGIVLGTSTSINDTLTFNPNLTGTPAAYIRGLLGGSSRVTMWSLGDDTVNINNATGGTGEVADFTAGTLNAMVGTLIVGQGVQGNTVNSAVTGTFNMGAGNLDVTSLKIGIGDNGKTGGMGIGVMNVTGGSVEAGTLSLAVTTPAATTATLNLMGGATLIVSNGVTLGAGTAGANLSIVSSTLKVLSGPIGTTNGLASLNLDGATVQLTLNGINTTAIIVATNVTTGATSTINISAAANLSGTVQIPLLSYVGTDPFNSLHLGSLPAGYTGNLVDNTGNSSVDLSVTSPFKPTPHFTGISISGTTLNLSATNGVIGGQYILLGTTNLTKPLSQWTPVLTNNFDGSGNLNLSTNIVNPAVPQEFYLISQ